MMRRGAARLLGPIALSRKASAVKGFCVRCAAFMGACAAPWRDAPANRLTGEGASLSPQLDRRGCSPPRATVGGRFGRPEAQTRSRVALRSPFPALGFGSGERLGSISGARRRRQGDFGEISRPRQLRAGAGRFSGLAGEPGSGAKSARGHAWPCLCARRQAGNSGAVGRNRMQRADGRRGDCFDRTSKCALDSTGRELV